MFTTLNHITSNHIDQSLTVVGDFLEFFFGAARKTKSSVLSPQYTNLPYFKMGGKAMLLIASTIVVL
jgi:hypothetical protein